LQQKPAHSKTTGSAACQEQEYSIVTSPQVEIKEKTLSQMLCNNKALGCSKMFLQEEGV